MSTIESVTLLEHPEQGKWWEATINADGSVTTRWGLSDGLKFVEFGRHTSRPRNPAKYVAEKVSVKCPKGWRPAAPAMTATQALLTAIATKHLDLETLETRGSDSMDFSNHAVWNIKAALEAAFRAGQQSR